MTGKVKVESSIPEYFAAQFEAGYAPWDEPPGMEERYYKAWKDAGGRVLTGEAAVGRAAALADEIVIQVDPTTGAARFLAPFDPDNQAPGSPREVVVRAPGEGFRVGEVGIPSRPPVYLRVAPFAPPVEEATLAEVLTAVVREIAFQRTVYPQSVRRSISSHVLVAQEELREAAADAVKGSHKAADALREVLQVAACAITCLVQHGPAERLDGRYGLELYRRGIAASEDAGDAMMAAAVEKLGVPG